MRHGSIPLARAKIAYEISPFDRPEKKIPIDNSQHTIGNRQDTVGNFPSGVVNSRKARPNLELMQHALHRKERGGRFNLRTRGPRGRQLRNQGIQRQMTLALLRNLGGQLFSLRVFRSGRGHGRASA